jgi:hypothetical protein
MLSIIIELTNIIRLVYFLKSDTIGLLFRLFTIGVMTGINKNLWPVTCYISSKNK